jgi:pimeloyl-ACP methyl ester carboxylesterase
VRSVRYIFDRLADIVVGLLVRLGLIRFVMFLFDFGAPVGFRLATHTRSGSQAW